MRTLGRLEQGFSISAVWRSVALVALGLALAAQPLSAACPTCTISSGPNPPDLVLSGTSAGPCWKAWIGFFIDDQGVAGKGCYEPTCSLDTTVDIACRRTGVYKLHAGCICGVWVPNPDGSSSCVQDTVDTVTSLSINTTPTVSPSVTGPDASGAATLTAPYTFPNTRNAMQRFLAAFDMRPEGPQDLSGFRPSESADNWILPLDTACWKQGSHQLKVAAIACGQDNDPAYKDEVFTTLMVDHEPQVSVGVEPAEGGWLVRVNYSFPQTRVPTQRFVAVWAYPAQDLVMSFHPAEREGEQTGFVSCADGRHRLVVADALACLEVLRSGAAGLPNCPKPPRKDDCNERDECNRCTGPDGGVSVGGGGSSFGADKALGPGAELYYLAGGVGSPGNPGQSEWSTTLGRHWVHSYSERIVPATADLRRVWFLTQFGSFREYTDAAGDGLYETASPEDEYRTLTRVGAGWELRDLAGTVTTFNSAGLWTGQQDRHGSAKTATYADGKLATVSFPDGRSELFSYDAASGKLAAITEVGVGGAEQRTWSYTWSGEDLIQVDRPDGISRRFVYGDPGLPGYMTRAILVGADDGDPLTPRPERIETAWEYDVEGNVVRTWRGADDFATGVDRYELAYDNPFEPRETTVTIYRNATEQDVVVYSLSRTAQWVGAKARVTAVSGDCPACGLGPGSALFYDDAQNPFRPTRIVDGRGIETHFTYDANGQVISKTEAAGTPESRTSEWEYHPTWLALPTRIDMPSTSGGAALRSTVLGYDAAGNLTSRRQQGIEDGNFFDLETVTTFNGAGQPLSIDPPGHGTADRTSFAYDSSRGELIPLTRTDPLIGDTTFEHDVFNRRTAVVDPNGLRTETTYDAGNRVTSVTQKGAVPAEDLVTTHIYTPFGDLFRTTLPRGNLIEHGYDAAGRLLSIERKPDASTPGERTLYTLDPAGNRIKEELQRWDGAAWVTESFTDFVYLNRCQIHKVVHADGLSTEHSYDCNGNLQEIWDANHPKGSNPNPTQLYAYDALNRLTSVTVGPGTADAAATNYTYDIQDHLETVTDAELNGTIYTTSDRDLMTRQESPVSGTTDYTYNEHGELLTTTDARAIVTTRTVDAADRVTQETFGPAGTPDPTLTTTYTYGSTPAQSDVGRLIGITRNSQTIAYTYDRFGRLLQDGGLAYEYDNNGNRTRITYPGSIAAIYTHDFADREATLSYDSGGGPQPLVSNATYKPLGPLSGLTLGNGVNETRLFDQRYFPERIQADHSQAGNLLDWNYTTDALGNLTAITGSIVNTTYNTVFGYQDNLYFLIQGDGPWGTRTWTYDKTGNRLSFSKENEPTQTYSYSGSGHNPKLSAVTPAPGLGTGSWSYTFDAAGNQVSVLETDNEGPVQTTLYDVGADNRMNALRTNTDPSRTDFLYDGRGYLREALLTVTGSSDNLRVTPVYSSEGMLMARTEERHWTGATIGPDGEDQELAQMSNETTQVFYFAGRPVAQHTTGPELLYLTTDHLGTPVLATETSGATVWAGGVEPFGTTWTAAPDNPDPDPLTVGGIRRAAAPSLSRLSSEKVFLRYPGQWASDAFRVTSAQGDIYYNVHRYYLPGTSRYAEPDPIGLEGGLNVYTYAFSSPLRHADPLGLATFICRRPLGDHKPKPGNTRTGLDIWGNPLYHQYVCVVNGGVASCGGQTIAKPDFFGMFGPGRPTRPSEGDVFEPSRCRKAKPDDTCIESCINRKMKEAKPYYGAAGPFTNCQEWADDAVTDCALECSYANCPNPLTCALNYLF